MKQTKEQLENKIRFIEMVDEFKKQCEDNHIRLSDVEKIAGISFDNDDELYIMDEIRNLYRILITCNKLLEIDILNLNNKEDN